MSDDWALAIQEVALPQFVDGWVATLSYCVAASASLDGRSLELIILSPPEGSPLEELMQTVPLQEVGLLTVIETAETVTQ